MTNASNSEATSPRPEQRRTRQSRLLKADITSKRLGKFSATVRNVSEQGLGGKAPVELDLGERVKVELPGLLPLLGTVRWTVNGQFGIETDKAVALDALRTANGGNLPGGDQGNAFPIMRPPAAPAKRPGLNAVSAPFGQAIPAEDYWMR